MVNNHYDVDESLKPARDVMDTMRSLAASWDKLRRLRGVLIEQKDTDASGDAVFANIAVRYGYGGVDTATKNTEAAASFAQIDSAFGNADAAVTQMLNRHL